MMSTFWQDLRHGARVLRLNWGMTLVAVITLTLGIGANTAIFSVVNAVLLTPLSYQEPERLISLSERSPQLEGMSIAYPNFIDWREQNRVFEQIAVYRRQSYNLVGSGEPERVIGGQVSADLFGALKTGPIYGRVFSAEEDKPGSAPIAVLGFGLWQRRFGGDAGIVGKTITLSNRSYTVVGIMPANFQFPSRVELWVPVGQESGNPNWQERGNHPGLYGIARLKPGVTLEQARADMDAVAIRLEQQYPKSNTGGRVSLVPLREVFVRNIRPALQVLSGAVLCVLLIACANVANLLLARAAARGKEIAVRTALGAGRGRIIRQLLTESLLLAIVGGAFGLLLAQWGVQLIIAINPNNLPRASEIGFNGQVLVFSLIASLLTGVLFGLVPAWQATRVDLNEALKDSGRSSTGGMRRQRFRSSLVIAEIALSLVLLMGAGLMLQSFYRLQNVDAGFKAEGLLTFQLSLPTTKYSQEEQRTGFFEEVLQRIATLPGVQVAAAASGLPLGNNGNQTSFVVEGKPEPPFGQMPLAEVVYISPGYLRAMGIALIKGRTLTGQDRKDQPRVLVVDEAFAQKYWPNEEAVGKRIRFGGPDSSNPLVTVVGVVRRVKMEGLDNDSGRVQAYLPYLQFGLSAMSIVVRASVDPLNLAAPVRQQVLAVDSDQPIYNLRTMEAIRIETLAPQRLNMLLLSIFAAVALVLAAVGIYGVMAYSVTQRTHELGIRMALGAERADVLKLVVGQAARLSGAGLAIGLAGAFLLTRWMSSLLFGVSATDPLTFFCISALLAGVAMAATIIPARRAMRVDPMIALRYE